MADRRVERKVARIVRNADRIGMARRVVADNPGADFDQMCVIFAQTRYGRPATSEFEREIVAHWITQAQDWMPQAQV